MKDNTSATLADINAQVIRIVNHAEHKPDVDAVRRIVEESGGGVGPISALIQILVAALPPETVKQLLSEEGTPDSLKAVLGLVDLTRDLGPHFTAGLVAGLAIADPGDGRMVGLLASTLAVTAGVELVKSGSVSGALANAMIAMGAAEVEEDDAS